MNFEQAREAALALLKAKGRAKNSELLAALDGDHDLLARVREALIFDDMAKDKDGVGLVGIAPSLDVVAVAPPQKPKVFLSYGRGDAALFVDRLCVDLAAADFDVWRDTREIHSGQDWQTEIVDGLRTAQVVVAVMTPHSVRTTRVASGSNQVDSVCLSEIAYALFNPPPHPVVPVMAQTCEPPLTIFHLHYVDMRAWQDSESQYRAGLQRLIDGIQAALRGEKRYRSWHNQLDPFDFAPFLYGKRLDFSGRQWLFDKLDSWRSASGRERALLIKGDPGVGKSAIVAELVHRNPDGQVLAFHCCQWDYGETLKPGRFVRSLAAMIASTLEAYADLLQHDPALRDLLSEGRCDSDPGSALEAAVFAPLERLRAPTGGPRYILIDALDEALLVHPGAGTIVDVLASRLGRLPGWVRLVATTRNDPLVLDKLGGLRAEELEAQSADNLDDLRQFLDLQLATPNLWECLTRARVAASRVRESLIERSEGNFLYVRQALEALELGQLDPQQLDQLPPGMAGLYAVRFKKLFPGDADFAGPKRVFEVLAAAQEPLSVTQLAAVTELEADEALPALLKRLATYVPQRITDDGQGRYTFYHKSLSDWLVDPQRLGLPYSVNLKAGHRRLADLGWAEYVRGVVSLSPYSLRHLPRHLLGAERWSDAARLLMDLSYLEAKNVAGLVFQLGSDLAAAARNLPEDHPLRKMIRLLEEALRRDINFVARHSQDYPQALFQCLWNSCWWYDNLQVAAHYVRPKGGWKQPPPWERSGPKLCDLLTEWRTQREDSTPGFPWLRALRPPSVHLGTAQRAVLRGHDQPVQCVSYSRDGTQIVSGSRDGTLRVWDAESGAELSVLRGDNLHLTSVGYSPDGTRIVSGSDDNTVRVWDARRGAERIVLRGHKGWVRSVSYSPNGTRIVSGSWDKTLRLWDAESGAELSILRGHEAMVTSVSYSPDGTRIVSGSEDKTVRMWDAASGAELSVLCGHDAMVTSVNYSPDGTRIVSGSEDKTIRVWDVASGAELSMLRGHEAMVTSVSYSPDGTRIVSGSEDKTIRVWDAARAAELSVLRGHEGVVESVSCSSDGTRIVSGSRDMTVRVWDSASAVELSLLRGHGDVVTRVNYSPDGTRIVSGSLDDTLRVWDAESGEELLVLHGHERAVSSARFSPDGMRIVSGSWDNTLRVWDAKSGSALSVLRGHDGWVKNVTYSADGTRIVSESGDMTLRVWDAKSGAALSVLPGHEFGVESVSYSPDGTLIAVKSKDGILRVWNAASGAELSALNSHEAMVTSVCYSPDSMRIVSGSYDGTLRVWDATSCTELFILRGHDDWVMSVSYSPNGKQIISGSYDGTLRVWDAVSGAQLFVMCGHDAMVMSVGYSPDGTRTVSGSWDKTLRMWDTKSGSELSVLRGHEGCVRSVCYSPDGTRIVSGSRDNTVRVWNAETGAELSVMRGHEHAVRSVCYSPDGTRIVSGSYDGTLRVWDAMSSAELSTLRGHTDWVTSVRYSSDGIRIASGSDDGTLRVWDAESGTELLVMCGHAGWVRSVCFSPDGTRIVSGSEDKTLRLWDSQSGAELSVLRRLKDQAISVIDSPDRTRIVRRSYDQKLGMWNVETVDCLDVIRVPSDVTATECASRERLWRAEVHDLETILKTEADAHPIGRFPEHLEEIVASPSGRAWAGKVGHAYLQIIQLEGSVNRRPSSTSAPM